jgi:hypothetical protein
MSLTAGEKSTYKLFLPRQEKAKTARKAVNIFDVNKRHYEHIETLLAQCIASSSTPSGNIRAPTSRSSAQLFLVATSKRLLRKGINSTRSWSSKSRYNQSIHLLLKRIMIHCESKRQCERAFIIVLGRILFPDVPHFFKTIKSAGHHDGTSIALNERFLLSDNIPRLHRESQGGLCDVVNDDIHHETLSS